MPLSGFETLKKAHKAGLFDFFGWAEWEFPLNFPGFKKPVDARVGPHGLIEAPSLMCAHIFSGNDDLIRICYQRLAQEFFREQAWISEGFNHQIEAMLTGGCQRQPSSSECFRSLRMLDNRLAYP